MGLVVALGKKAALLGEPSVQILQAAAEDFGLRRLGDQLALELGDAIAEIFDLVALVSELLGRHIGLAVHAGGAGLGVLYVLLRALALRLEGPDLHPERGDLDPLAVGP